MASKMISKNHKIDAVNLSSLECDKGCDFKNYRDESEQEDRYVPQARLHIENTLTDWMVDKLMGGLAAKFGSSKVRLKGRTVIIDFE